VKANKPKPVAAASPIVTGTLPELPCIDSSVSLVENSRLEF